ncbi:hypothetical protein [Jiangella mangrovi]|uniref:ATP/GTP-binding protein n=1 Tax=Jiangella mangrovi TaxID=1524084 RepID=A0A7W9LNQ3_9ACTN|nr:hypothetical protein [Jiangella mangrovi]MBB5790511.1 hypothetical protein [Jiangella mangrovi]
MALAAPAEPSESSDAPRANGCPPGTYFNGSGCVYEEPPTDEDTDDDAYLTHCSQDDPQVVPAPCTIAGYEFSDALDRYLKRLSPAENELHRPPDGTLSHLGYWTGDPAEGWMFEWRKLAGVAGGIHWGDHGYMWLAEAPGETPVIVVDPEEVAQQILDGMSFEPLEVGLAPRPLETDPQSIGLVGAPVWMWVTNAGPTTWGPREESATVGGVTVTVTAEVDHVAWDMGDGTTVTCEEPGTPYEPSLGVRPSPSCGHAYTQTSSAYTVTATANWAATWTASTGAEGTLDPPDPATTATVRIGERQVIETS